MAFNVLQYNDGSLAVVNSITGVTVFSVSAADVIAFNATSITMTREALAAAGSDATDGGAVTKQISCVTAADGTKGVVLPAAATTTGPLLIINTVTTATLKVYPVNGGNDNINALAEDAAFTMGPGKSAWFVPVSAAQWYVDDISSSTSTTAEIDRAADVSTRNVAIGATAAVPITAEGRTVTITQGGAANTAIALTLPEATGSGAIYTFVCTEANTGGVTIAALTTDTLVGSAYMLDNDSTAVTSYSASGTDDKIVMNATTTGGQIGDKVIFTDFADAKWSVQAFLNVPTGSNIADPFAAT